MAFLARRLLLISVILMVSTNRGRCEDVKPFDNVPNWGIVVDPAGDCRFEHEDDKFTIKLPGEYRDLWPVKGKVNAPLVLQDVEGDFTVEVKIAHLDDAEKDSRIAGLPGTASFHAGSLLIWQDNKNFVRFDRTSMDRKGEAITSCYLHVFKDGERVAEVAQVIPDKTTQIRLSRKGDRVTAAFSQDGRKWTSLAAQKADLPPKVKVGISALNNTVSGSTVTFQSLKIGK